MKLPATVLAAAAFSPLARAQFTTDTTVTYTLSWRESDAAGLPLGTSNGILEPGEHALLSISASFTNQFTVATFAPPVGTHTSGTIRGFGLGHLDLIGTDAEGSWHLDSGATPQMGAVDPWNLIGQPGAGTPVNGGARLINITFGQLREPAAINTQNPVQEPWRGVWSPASFAPRSVRFELAAGSSYGGLSSGVQLRFGISGTAMVFCPGIFDDLEIPVVPGPGPLAVLALGWTGRRRRVHAGVRTQD